VKRGFSEWKIKPGTNVEVVTGKSLCHRDSRKRKAYGEAIWESHAGKPEAKGETESQAGTWKKVKKT